MITADMKAAMKAKDTEKLTAIRAIKAEILKAETEKGAGDEVGEEREVAILQKMLKQRRESADLYNQQGREDLASEELSQAEVIESYLPEQMSEEEVSAVVKSIIEKVGASGPSDMGKVMGPVMGQLKGKADGKLISTVVKSLLS